LGESGAVQEKRQMCVQKMFKRIPGFSLFLQAARGVGLGTVATVCGLETPIPIQPPHPPFLRRGGRWTLLGFFFLLPLGKKSQAHDQARGNCPSYNGSVKKKKPWRTKSCVKRIPRHFTGVPAPLYSHEGHRN